MNADKFQHVFGKISRNLDLEIRSIDSLTGGDINEVFVITSDKGKFVIKINDASRFPGMFDAEKLGLDLLREPEVFDVPQPLETGIAGSHSYLILECIDTGTPSADFWRVFGEQVAKLHQTSASSFGLRSDNYIGSLPQYNQHRNSASAFYIDMRLQPQLTMAAEKGFDLNVSDKFLTNCKELIPEEPPALVHGDLWNGNYLVNSRGLPCLIDPAVAFAPREMDLGMMHLFGGFSSELFDIYNEIYPLQGNWKDRLDLWKLYYLLVHLNIFGAGYLNQVNSIISRYS